MATRKRSIKSPAATNEQLWLLNFQADYEDCDEPHHLAFQLLVPASGLDVALERARARLLELQHDQDVFDHPYTIYLDHAIQVPLSCERVALLNYRELPHDEENGRSYFAALPGDDEGFGVHWPGPEEDVDDYVEEPFLELAAGKPTISSVGVHQTE